MDLYIVPMPKYKFLVVSIYGYRAKPTTDGRTDRQTETIPTPKKLHLDLPDARTTRYVIDLLDKIKHTILFIPIIIL
jgi:hypothetical protein